MYVITLTTVGKQKSGPLQELSETYEKRLRPYFKVQTERVKEEAFPPTDRQRGLLKEAERLQKRFERPGVHIVLDAGTKTQSSEQFAKQLDAWSQHATQVIHFYIGGALGLHPSIKQKANHILSLSALTFTHELTLVLLLEQLFRAATILKGKTYHY